MEAKLKVCPYQLEDQIKSATSGSLKNITTSGRDAQTVQTRHKKQSIPLEAKKNVQNLSCKADPHKYFNYSKAIIYINDYDL